MTGEAPPMLRIDGLTHAFGGMTAVEGFDAELRPGEIVGLIGPNGGGKTTVFNLLCGLYHPTAGSMSFEGSRLNGRRPHEITALGIGRTFQNIRLWNQLTVLDNLRIARWSHLGYGLVDAILASGRMRADERAITEEAHALLGQFGLESQAGARPGSLPYGVQRRVEICRALAMRPRLLLLDEPAAGMNQGEIGALMELIAWVRDTYGVAIWIIEHQMRVIMGICERIQVLSFGNTIAAGTPEQIRNDPGVVAAYLGKPVA